MTDKRALYDELGVEPDADAGAIERAYRKKAQRAHPDKGGSAEKFHAIQVAYGILSDEEKRKRYDATGDAEQSRQEQIASILVNMVMSFVDNADIEHDDMVAGMKRIVAGNIEKSRAEIQKLQVKIDRRQRALKRIKRKTNDAANVFALSLTANIRALERAIATLEADIELGQIVLKTLEEYRYEVDLILPKFTFSSGVFSGGGVVDSRGP